MSFVSQAENEIPAEVLEQARKEIVQDEMLERAKKRVLQEEKEKKICLEFAANIVARLREIRREEKEIKSLLDSVKDISNAAEFCNAVEKHNKKILKQRRRNNANYFDPAKLHRV